MEISGLNSSCDCLTARRQSKTGKLHVLGKYKHAHQGFWSYETTIEYEAFFGGMISLKTYQEQQAARVATEMGRATTQLLFAIGHCPKVTKVNADIESYNTEGTEGKIEVWCWYNAPVPNNDRLNRGRTLKPIGSYVNQLLRASIFKSEPLSCRCNLHDRTCNSLANFESGKRYIRLEQGILISGQPHSDSMPMHSVRKR